MSYILLGNLELKDIVSEAHLEKIKSFLDNNGYRRETVCDKIESEEGNYHIFDIPKQMQICGREKMEAFINFLKANDLVAVGFKERIGLTYLDKK